MYDVIHVLGKGSRGRAVPFGDKTGTALDRYLRERAKHPNSGLPALWLGIRSAMTTSGMRCPVDASHSISDVRIDVAERSSGPLQAVGDT